VTRIPTGSRWSVRKAKGANVWQVVRGNRLEYTLRCVEAVADKFGHAVGDEISVAPEWFAVRGQIGANTAGAVRAVSP
jgi:hypothetical protein